MKINLLKFFFILSLITISSSGFTQTSSIRHNNLKNTAAEKNELNSIAGTYQIEVINTRLTPSIPGNLEEIIRNNRHQTKTIYVELGTMVRLKILSNDEINKIDFKPLKQIIHIFK